MVDTLLCHGFQDLARTVNSGMLGAGHPQGWFRNVRNYVREDRIIEELLEEKVVVTAVLLKMLVRINCFSWPSSSYSLDCVYPSKRLCKTRISDYREPESRILILIL